MSDKHVELVKGREYRVLKAGAFLTNTVSIAPNTWTDKREPLPVGAVIEYLEHKNCWGCDPIPIPNFRFGDVEGEFRPTDWTQVEKEWLEAYDG